MDDFEKSSNGAEEFSFSAAKQFSGASRAKTAHSITEIIDFIKTNPFAKNKVNQYNNIQSMLI